MEEIKPIYDQVKQHPDKIAEEIYHRDGSRKDRHGWKTKRDLFKS